MCIARTMSIHQGLWKEFFRVYLTKVLVFGRMLSPAEPSLCWIIDMGRIFSSRAIKTGFSSYIYFSFVFLLTTKDKISVKRYILLKYWFTSSTLKKSCVLYWYQYKFVYIFVYIGLFPCFLSFFFFISFRSSVLFQVILQGVRDKKSIHKIEF